MKKFETFDELIHTHFETEEELFETLYYYFACHVYNELLFKRVVENNAHLGITDVDFEKTLLKYKQDYYRKIENTEMKLMKMKDLRNLVKELHKFTSPISQTKLKEIVSHLISMIIYYISLIQYCDAFNNDTISDVFALVYDKNELFHYFKHLMCINAQDFEIQLDSERLRNETLCILFAQYYLSKHDDTYQQHELIALIEKALNMPLHELDHFLLNYYYHKEVYTKDKVLHKTIFDDQSFDFDNEEMTRMETIIEDLISLKDEDIIQNQTKKFYDQYVNQSVLDFHDMVEYVRFTYSANKMMKKGIEDTGNSLTIYLAHIIHECSKKSDMFPDDDSIADAFDIFNYDFLLYFSYHLLEGNDAFKKDLLDACQYFVESNLASANQYSEHMRLLSHSLNRFNYTPTQIYECFIFISVFLQFDTNSTIRKKIIAVFEKHYGFINEKLAFYNKKQHQEYSENYDTPPSQMHEYAVVFFWNYLKNKVYLASMSVFLFEFESIMVDYHATYAIDKDIINNIGSDRYENHPDRKIWNDSYKFIDDLLVQYSMPENDSDRYGIIAQGMKKKLIVMSAASILNPYLIDEYKDFEYIVRKRQKELAYIISNCPISYCDDFYALDKFQQFELLWSLAIEVSLFKEVYESEKFIPKTQEIEKDAYVKSLEETIEKQNNTITSHLSTIDSYKNQISKTKEESKQLEENLYKKHLQTFKEETKTLNKQLQDKERYIKQLEEEKEELHKLRELLFTLQEDEDVQIKEDYGSKLKAYTKQYRIICVGGHVRMLNLLKAKYPDIAFITSDKGITHQNLRNCDYLFCFYKNIDHPFYYKVMHALQSHPHISWDYITTRNIEMMEKEIVSKIENSKK